MQLQEKPPKTTSPASQQSTKTTEAAPEAAPKAGAGSAVYNLLADMASDPQVFEEYKHNRSGLLEKYDLTEEQRQLIMQGGEENYIKILIAERARIFGSLSV